MKPDLRFRRAFTLVELLVVIVIIAVLSTFVLSMIRRGKQSALSAATLNNLREIGAAEGTWRSENNGFIIYPNWDQGKNQSWAQLLDPFMHGAEKVRTTESKFIGPNKRLPVKVSDSSHPITYSLNQAVSPDSDEIGRGVLPVQPSKVHNLSQVILMADGCQNPSNSNQANASASKLYVSTGSSGRASRAAATVQTGPDEDTASGAGWFRYDNNKCHVLYCDGSAGTIAKGKMTYRNIWYDMQ